MTDKTLSLYGNVPIRKTTLARIKAIVEMENKANKAGKPMTLAYWCNRALTEAADKEKDGAE